MGVVLALLLPLLFIVLSRPGLLEFWRNTAKVVGIPLPLKGMEVSAVVLGLLGASVCPDPKFVVAEKNEN